MRKSPVFNESAEVETVMVDWLAPMRAGDRLVIHCYEDNPPAKTAEAA